MRLRIGFVLGFGSGYYLGSRAGRARYEQINRLLAKARGSDAYEAATHKAKGLVDETLHRAEDFVEEHRGGNGHQPESAAAGVSYPSPGPPPAGALSPDPPVGGPPPP